MKLKVSILIEIILIIIMYLKIKKNFEIFINILKSYNKIIYILIFFRKFYKTILIRYLGKNKIIRYYKCKGKITKGV